MINIGIIGSGYWGPNLIRNFIAQDQTNVLAVADLAPERLTFVAKHFPSVKDLYVDANQIINSKSIDAVVIATPVSTHYDLANRALDNGKHLLVEKPFVASTSEGRALIEKAKKKKLVIGVDHTFLYTGAVEKMKQLVDSGDVGTPYYFDSVRVNLGLFQHDVNVIWDLAPHDLSIMQYLLPESPATVSATGISHFGNGLENIAYLTVNYSDSLIGHIHVNWLAPVKVRRTLLSGSKRMIIYDDMEPSEKIKVYDRGVDFVKDREDIYDMLVQYRTGDMYAPKLDPTEALSKMVDEFVGAIEGNKAMRSDGVDGLKVVCLLEAAQKSLAGGGVAVEVETV